MPNPAVVGETVTLTATVSGSTPTGLMMFKDGGTAISGCSAQAVEGNGQAICATSSLTIGTHSLSAEYGGDVIFNPSTSASYSQVVKSPLSYTYLPWW